MSLRQDLSDRTCGWDWTLRTQLQCRMATEMFYANAENRFIPYIGNKLHEPRNPFFSSPQGSYNSAPVTAYYHITVAFPVFLALFPETVKEDSCNY